MQDRGAVKAAGDDQVRVRACACDLQVRSRNSCIVSKVRWRLLWVAGLGLAVVVVVVVVVVGSELAVDQENAQSREQRGGSRAKGENEERREEEDISSRAI